MANLFYRSLPQSSAAFQYVSQFRLPGPIPFLETSGPGMRDIRRPHRERNNPAANHDEPYPASLPTAAVYAERQKLKPAASHGNGGTAGPDPDSQAAREA